MRERNCPGRMSARQGELWTVLSARDGIPEFEPVFNGIDFSQLDSTGLLSVRCGKLFGLARRNGELIAPCNFTAIDRIDYVSRQGLAERDGKLLLITITQKGTLVERAAPKSMIYVVLPSELHPESTDAGL